MRLIDADALVGYIDARHIHGESERVDPLYKIPYQIIRDYIECDMPTIDAVPVVHARWVDACYGYRNCSKCDCEHPIRDAKGFLVDDDYCPVCGTKMDGGETDGK